MLLAAGRRRLGGRRPRLRARRPRWSCPVASAICLRDVPPGRPGPGVPAATRSTRWSSRSQIAWVGTLIGAALSLPLGFLAAPATSRGGPVCDRRPAGPQRHPGLPGDRARDRDLHPHRGARAVRRRAGHRHPLGGHAGQAHGRGHRGHRRRARSRPHGRRARGSSRSSAGASCPQVLPEIIGFWLYRFEINIRAAAVLGVVGAGGIGFAARSRRSRSGASRRRAWPSSSSSSRRSSSTPSPGASGGASSRAGRAARAADETELARRGPSAALARTRGRLPHDPPSASSCAPARPARPRSWHASRRRPCARSTRAVATAPSRPTRCARPSSATGTGSCTARPSGGSSTRRRSSSTPRATTTSRA